MDEATLSKRVQWIAYAMAGLFLLIHVAMILIFFFCGVVPMVYVNIGSIAFYGVMIFLIVRKHYAAFVIATYVEINVHMGLAIVYTGWNVGFQITLIGIVLLLFFCEYIARTLKLRYIPSLFLAPLSFLIYIGAYVASVVYPAPYPLPSGMNIALEVSWAVVVFSIMCAILWLFVSTTTSSQTKLTNEVVHDKLTGLPNRYYAAAYFAKFQEMRSPRRHWAALADIDDFKIINDTYGHNCGDYVLKTIASLFLEMQQGVEICRWGGEEFLFVGEEATNPAEYLRLLSEKVRDHLFQYEGTEFHLTLTIGFAWKDPKQSIDEWINNADRKLYEGKKDGKNRIRC